VKQDPVFEHHGSSLDSEHPLGDPAAKVFPNKAAAKNPASREIFDLALHWIQDCLSSHYTCSEKIKPRLPRRLIEVGNPDRSIQPRLWTPYDEVPGEGQQAHNQERMYGRYAALSYCWGTTTFLTTTSSTLEKRKLGIPLDTLPQTIQDAITITRQLGIQYLWVDALCILQGSDDEARKDWETESAKMKDIYQNAFLTIAAASASSAIDGILVDRRPSPYPHVKIPYPSAQNLTGYVSIGPHHGFEHTKTEPLSRRGWALQEKILSARVLTYGGSEIHWNCSYANRSETGQYQGSGMKSHVEPDWHAIIEDYSSRELTLATDKLPAVSGLADVQQKLTGDVYLAGLWKSSLWDDLLWKHVGKVENGMQIYPQPTQYRAPSWSWASVDGRVKFFGSDEVRSFLIADRSTWDGFDVLHCSITSSSRQNLGGITDASLLVFGLVKQVPSIRLAAKGAYYGCYEHFDPWMQFPKTLETWLDNVNALTELWPESTTPATSDAPKELLNARFLFTLPNAGLILLPRQRSTRGTPGWVDRCKGVFMMPAFVRVGMFRFGDSSTSNKGPVFAELDKRILRIV
jgi:hypothetical protein